MKSFYKALKGLEKRGAILKINVPKKKNVDVGAENIKRS